MMVFYKPQQKSHNYHQFCIFRANKARRKLQVSPNSPCSVLRQVFVFVIIFWRGRRCCHAPNKRKETEGKTWSPSRSIKPRKDKKIEQYLQGENHPYGGSGPAAYAQMRSREHEAVIGTSSPLQTYNFLILAHQADVILPLQVDS